MKRAFAPFWGTLNSFFAGARRPPARPPAPPGLESLEDLYVFRTDLTIKGIRELKRLRPGCRIYYRSEQEPE